MPSSWARGRRAARTSRSRAGTTPTGSTSGSTGSSRWPSSTSTASSPGCSSSASGTRRWTAAARRCGSGGTDVKVMARKSREYFKASPWELEDAEEELVEIVENHSPSRFVIEDGELVAMDFDVVDWYEGEGGRLRSQVRDTVRIPCDAVILAIGQGDRISLGRARSRDRVQRVGRTDCGPGPPSRARGKASSSAVTRHGVRRTSSGPSSTATRRRSRSTTTAAAFRSTTGCRTG